MAPIRCFGRFALAFVVMLLGVTGAAETSHGKAEIAGTYKMSLELVMPKEGTAFKVGENVFVTITSSGFTGVKVTAKDTATGREEELKASVANGLSIGMG